MVDFSCFARLVKNEFVTNYALNIYLYMYVKYMKKMNLYTNIYSK